MKRIICLLACVLAFMLLISCNAYNTDTTTDITTVPSGEENDGDITVEELAMYDIIKPSGSDKTVSSLGNSIKSAIKEKYGYILTYRSDVINENVEAYRVKELEILIGETNREETSEFLSSLRYNDYGYGLINKKLVIAGHTIEGTIKALEMFIADVIENGSTDDSMFFNGETSIIKAEYEREDLKIGSLSAKNMVIVYPTALERNEIMYAKELALLISEKSGYRVKAYVEHNYTPKEGDQVILMGDPVNDYGITVPSDLGDEEMYISVEDNAMIITAGCYYAFDRVANGFIEKVASLEGEALDNPELREDLHKDNLTVMSFNLWGWKRTSERDERIIKLLYEMLPDTIGFQEDLPGLIKMFEKELPFYGHVGVPVNGIDGASCSVFYLKDKFEVIDYGTKWLSATPDKISKFEESSENRIVTYVTLKCKATGEIFTHINTHLEHTNNTARELQAEVMLNVIGEIEGSVIMTGDFNSSKPSGPINKYLDAGYIDASTVADKAQVGPTFHGGDGTATSTIDFIFVNDGIEVLEYKVCNEQVDGGYVSDHHPVYVEYKLKNAQ